MTQTLTSDRTLTLAGPVDRDDQLILSHDALAFVGDLVHAFEPRRQELLAARDRRQERLDRGQMFDFLPETKAIRQADWRVAAIPKPLLDRRVEITGPVDRKMVINALNSGASVYMADFEDAHCPTWRATLDGQANLYDAVRRTITYTSPQGKHYDLSAKTATLMVRPRGWHLNERHVLRAGRPVSASLFDFGLFFFHNARALLERGAGPYFYLPKLESHLEARLWNEVFNMAQDLLNIPLGTIRATVLIETIPAAFEIDEILYELRQHSAGVNCGRWDYIFSIIKKFRGQERFTLPDRVQVAMTTHAMHSYSLLAIQTCHRRGAHAIGGMAANIPVKDDPRANQAAFEKVRADKTREAGDGHDGTWVAHPALVPPAREVFDQYMPGPNQIERRREDVRVAAADLLTVPRGTITEGGLRQNVDVAIQYLAAWLGGNGCVPLYNLMEDAATAEISRSQLWQWLHHENAVLSDGRRVTRPMLGAMFDERTKALRSTAGGRAGPGAEHYDLARQIIEEIVYDQRFTPFMTSVAYEHLA